MTVYSGESLGILVQTFNIYGVEQQPETAEYSIIRLSDDSIVRSDSLVPTGTSFVISITAEDNTIEGNSEERKVVIRWTYNDGDDAGVIVYYYTLEQP